MGEPRPLAVLVAPDKFKGSLTAAEVADSLSQGILTAGNDGVTSCRLLPLADGGDGSVDAAVAGGFTPLSLAVTGPTGHPVTTTVASDGDTAVVEVATTCGLAALHGARPDALGASSFGLGQAIRHALSLGTRRIVIALGGSATTDGGTGMLAALGARFLDAAGEEVRPCGGSLTGVRTIDRSALVSLSGVELIGASDVRNPLTGPEGAAHVFGPQKGADHSGVAHLDSALAHLIELAAEAGFPDARSLAEYPGAGSAGGIGYACLLLGGRLVSGADFFLDLLDFDTLAAASDLIVTGEGSMDDQTAYGKLVSVVAGRAGGRPVIAVVGRNTLTDASVRALGIARVHALVDHTDLDCSRDSALSAQLLVHIGAGIVQELVC